jgi:hypothetical protein
MRSLCVVLCVLVGCTIRPLSPEFHISHATAPAGGQERHSCYGGMSCAEGWACVRGGGCEWCGGPGLNRCTGGNDDQVQP